VVLNGGYRIGARQPAVEVYVGAAAGTERTKTLDLRLAADSARFGLADGTHGLNLRLPRAGRERRRSGTRLVFFVYICLFEGTGAVTTMASRRLRIGKNKK
jgi:hypothetical protein